MAKTIFEQIDGTYTLQGDYYLPDLTLPAEEERPIGVWEQRHRQYLKQHHKILYCNLLTSGKLHSHLADVEEEALLLSAVLFPHPVSKKDDVRIPARNTAAIFFFIIFATPFLFCSGRSCLCFFCFLYCKLSGFRAPDRICRFAGYLTRNAVQYSAKMFSSALPADLRKIPSTDLPQRQRRFP